MKIARIDGYDSPAEVCFRAARNDYSATNDPWVGEATVDELRAGASTDTIADFIDRAMDRGHWGVFEHAQATFAIEGASRVAMAQLSRHRHASFDIQSLRYTGFEDARWLNRPLADIKREKILQFITVPPTIDQAGGPVRQAYLQDCCRAFKSYYEMVVNHGVEKEDARYVLPLSTQVNIVFSMNARALLHLFDIRHKADVQSETYDIADGVLAECVAWFPECFERYTHEFHPRANQLAP